MDNRQNWQDWLIGIVGVWLIISPWILDYGTGGTGSALAVDGLVTSTIFLNFVIVGAIVVILAGAALMARRQWEEWVEGALGLWLVASPWLLQFTGSRQAVWSAVASGLVIIVSAGWNLIAERQAGHA